MQPQSHEMLIGRFSPLPRREVTCEPNLFRTQCVSKHGHILSKRRTNSCAGTSIFWTLVGFWDIHLLCRARSACAVGARGVLRPTIWLARKTRSAEIQAAAKLSL